QRLDDGGHVFGADAPVERGRMIQYRDASPFVSHDRQASHVGSFGLARLRKDIGVSFPWPSHIQRPGTPVVNGSGPLVVPIELNRARDDGDGALTGRRRLCRFGFWSHWLRLARSGTDRPLAQDEADLRRLAEGRRDRSRGSDPRRLQSLSEMRYVA